MTVKVQGERWFPSDIPFSDEIAELWGDWYCDSEVGTLRAVLMHRPGKEIDGVDEHNFGEYRFRAPMIAEKARLEQDGLAAVYRAHGVEVYYVEGQRLDKPNAMFVRDLMLMTPEGAIIGRPAFAARRGEEKAIAATLARLGVPIIKTINADGYFEGACAMWIDRQSIVLGTSSRANEAGIRQVENELRNMGVINIIKTQIPYGSIHLDGYINMVDKNKALIFPWHLSYDCARALMDLGIELIEATDITEIKQGMAINVVALSPGKVVMAKGNPNTKATLEGAGVEVIEVEISELMKGWGAVHCMTGFLRRDPIYLR
jgi:N-dimethylarginine dimethylaminohydrolase